VTHTTPSVDAAAEVAAVAASLAKYGLKNPARVDFAIEWESLGVIPRPDGGDVQVLASWRQEHRYPCWRFVMVGPDCPQDPDSPTVRSTVNVRPCDFDTAFMLAQYGLTGFLQVRHEELDPPADDDER
jgi:hypothetical protein